MCALARTLVVLVAVTPALVTAQDDEGEAALRKGDALIETLAEVSAPVSERIEFEVRAGQNRIGWATAELDGVPGEGGGGYTVRVRLVVQIPDMGSLVDGEIETRTDHRFRPSRIRTVKTEVRLDGTETTTTEECLFEEGKVRITRRRNEKEEQAREIEVPSSPVVGGFEFLIGRLGAERLDGVAFREFDPAAGGVVTRFVRVEATKMQGATHHVRLGTVDPRSVAHVGLDDDGRLVACSKGIVLWVRCDREAFERAVREVPPAR